MGGQELGPRRLRTFEVLLPHLLGLGPESVEDVAVAGGRLQDFVAALPEPGSAASIRQLLDAVNALSLVMWVDLPGTLGEEQRRQLVARLLDPEERWPGNPLSVLKRIFGESVPSVRDLGRALRELATLTVYGDPGSDAHTGFVPLSRRPAVLAVDPSSATAAPYTRAERRRLDVPRIREAHRPAAQPPDGWFRGDGRPRVAIVGAGPGGAVAASILAPTCDVAIFEAGPELKPRQYPVDPLAGMALLYSHGLLYPTRDLDLRILQARVVGGGSAINEGVSVRPRRGTLDRWTRDGMGLDRAALSESLDAVERRQRFSPYRRDLFTSAALAFERGAGPAGLEVGVVRSDVATHPEQHGDHPPPDVIGPRCLACGYCNHGCRFGHHLSVDRTFLVDARAAGARLFASRPVERLILGRGPGLRVTGLSLGRGEPVVQADAVILAAGALGSAALLQRSVRRSPRLGRLPSHEAGWFGGGLGFNYGTPVVARWPDAMPRPGWDGLQVAFLATKPGDERFILENGFVPPGVMAPVVPGVGSDHRRWMGHYSRMAMCVNTIGGHSDGRVDRQGRVSYRIGPPALDTIHESLAALVDAYLHAGAVEVALAGLVRVQPDGSSFDPSWTGQGRRILDRIRRLAPSAEHLALASGHPQGGLRMHRDPERGAVGPDYRLHGVDNVYVSDASLFPTTITLNPQWLVMALARVAATSILTSLRPGPR